MQGVSEKQTSVNNDAYLHYKTTDYMPYPTPHTPIPPHPQSGCLRQSRLLIHRSPKHKMLPLLLESSARSRWWTVRCSSLSRSHLLLRLRVSQSNFAHPFSILLFLSPTLSSSSRASPLSLPPFLPQSAAVIHNVDVKYRLTITDQVVSGSTNKKYFLREPHD